MRAQRSKEPQKTHVGWRHRRRGITHLVPKHLLTHFLFEKGKGTIGPGESQKSSTVGKVKSFLQHSSDQTEGTRARGQQEGTLRREANLPQALPSPQFSPTEAFLAIRSPILLPSPIQQVKMTLESLQNQSKKLLAKSQETRSFRWSSGQLAWMVATRTWKSRSPAQLQNKICMFLRTSEDPCSVIWSR